MTGRQIFTHVYNDYYNKDKNLIAELDLYNYFLLEAKFKNDFPKKLKMIYKKHFSPLDSKKKNELSKRILRVENGFDKIYKKFFHFQKLPEMLKLHT